MSSSPNAEPKQRVSSVIDSSALLALIFEEPGASIVETALDDGAVVSSVNLSEVIAKLSDSGDPEQALSSLQSLKFDVANFDEDAAWLAGTLRAQTRSLGLSLGDRACLALAMSMNAPVMTADRVWTQLDVGVRVVLCREP
jgi:PIN domain nuclease of toxin-antitoxin system